MPKKPKKPKVLAPKKRRGRKPKNSKIYDINLHSPIKNIIRQDNLILHLRVKASELEDKQIIEPNAFDPLIADKTVAAPYNIKNDEQLIESDNNLDVNKEIVIEIHNKLVAKRLRKVLIPFQDFNKTHIWPEKTSIACYWCCHEFNTVPVSIPVKYENKKFHVYGCFCSYNCAAAYIFDARNYDMWDQYSLLNFMFKKIHPKSAIEKIELSPPRCILKKFGGFSSIEEYREKIIIEKSYDIIQPPMISLVPQVEENSSWSGRKTNSKFLDFGQEELVLTRNKPINKGKRTLMHYLNFG